MCIMYTFGSVWSRLCIFFEYVQTVIIPVWVRWLYQLPRLPSHPTPSALMEVVVVDYADMYKDKLKSFAGYLRKYDDVPVSSDWHHLMNVQLLEYTPLGNVLMYYDSSKDTFVYYSDRVLAYSYIDTVARKYVMTYNCTTLYLDINSKDSRGTTETLVSVPKEGVLPNGQKKIGGVFATFKTYNAPKMTTLTHSHQKINRYTYGGKLANFMFLKKPAPRATMSYAEFKNKLKIGAK